MNRDGSSSPTWASPTSSTARRPRRVEKRIRLYKPRQAAFLGLGLYRDAFDRPEARVGLQRETIGRTLLWVFPNPSGLNAHFQVPDYARLFRRLRGPIAKAGK